MAAERRLIMLVLTRRIDESILIGDPHSGKTPLTVKILAVNGEDVVIGIKGLAGVRVEEQGVAASGSVRAIDVQITDLV